MDEQNRTNVENSIVSPALAIFALALVARAIFLYQSLATPYFGAPFLDEQYYYEWAVRVSRGQLQSAEAFFRAPLYAYLLGGLFALVGPNFFLPKLLQHLLGSVAAVLVFKIAERCFDGRTAWVAGLLAAVYPPVIFYEGEMVDISLQCFFYPALVLVGLISLSDRRWRWTVLFGIVAGAAAIARPNILLLVACWLALQVMWAPHWGGRREALARAAAIVALLFLWMVPPLVHNVRADGSWVPISTYAGINFYLGNRPSADGYTASTPLRYEFFGAYQDSVAFFARRRAEKIEARPLNGGQIQRFWFAQAWSEIGAAPDRTLALLFKKSVLFWNGYEIRNNKDIYFAFQFTPALDWIHRAWNFRVLSPLALLGMLLVVWSRRAQKGRQRSAVSHQQSAISNQPSVVSHQPSVVGQLSTVNSQLLTLSTQDSSASGGLRTHPPQADSALLVWLFLAVLAHMTSVVLFFVCDRYRLPVAPLLIVFAASAVVALWQRIGERESRAVAISVVGLACLAALANVRWYDVSPTIPHKDIWNVANCYKAKGDLDEALTWYKRFVGLNPKFADGWNNLGEVHARMALRGGQMDRERLQEALSCFQRAAQLDPRLSMAENNAGFCHLKLGNTSESLAAYERAIKKEPQNRLARNGRAEALAALGRHDEALAELDGLLAADPDFVPALWTKAAILALRGDVEQARRLALRAVEMAPSATAAEIRFDPALANLFSSDGKKK